MGPKLRYPTVPDTHLLLIARMNIWLVLSMLLLVAVLDIWQLRCCTV
jgi:hypothetical protein